MCLLRTGLNPARKVIRPDTEPYVSEGTVNLPGKKSQTEQTTKDSVQRFPLGSPGEWATETTPRASFLPEGINRTPLSVLTAWKL